MLKRYHSNHSWASVNGITYWYHAALWWSHCEAEGLIECNARTMTDRGWKSLLGLNVLVMWDSLPPQSQPWEEEEEEKEEEEEEAKGRWRGGAGCHESTWHMKWWQIIGDAPGVTFDAFVARKQTLVKPYHGKCWQGSDVETQTHLRVDMRNTTVVQWQWWC